MAATMVLQRHSEYSNKQLRLQNSSAHDESMFFFDARLLFFFCLISSSQVFCFVFSPCCFPLFPVPLSLSLLLHSVSLCPSSSLQMSCFFSFLYSHLLFSGSSLLFSGSSLLFSGSSLLFSALFPALLCSSPLMPPLSIYVLLRGHSPVAQPSFPHLCWPLLVLTFTCSVLSVLFSPSLLLLLCPSGQGRACGLTCLVQRQVRGLEGPCAWRSRRLPPRERERVKRHPEHLVVV